MPPLSTDQLEKRVRKAAASRVELDDERSATAQCFKEWNSIIDKKLDVVNKIEVAAKHELERAVSKGKISSLERTCRETEDRITNEQADYNERPVQWSIDIKKNEQDMKKAKNLLEEQRSNNDEKKLMHERAALSDIQSDILASRVSLGESREELKRSEEEYAKTKSAGAEIGPLRLVRDAAIAEWHSRWKKVLPWPEPENRHKIIQAGAKNRISQLETELKNTKAQLELEKETKTNGNSPYDGKGKEHRAPILEPTQDQKSKDLTKAEPDDKKNEMLTDPSMKDPQEWLPYLEAILPLALARGVGVRCPTIVKTDNHIAHIDQHRQNASLPLIDAMLVIHCWELISIKDAKSDASHRRRFRDTYSFGVEMVYELRFCPKFLQILERRGMLKLVTTDLNVHPDFETRFNKLFLDENCPIDFYVRPLGNDKQKIQERRTALNNYLDKESKRLKDLEKAYLEGRDKGRERSSM